MKFKKRLYIAILFVIPFLLGIGIIGYWYYTSRIEKQVMLPNYGAVPKFLFTTESNQPFSQADLIGRVYIVDFIFTQCAGTCPMMSAKMKQLQDTLSQQPYIRFLSISVDPETDTPDVLTRYASTFSAINGRWIFLTGNKKEIYKLSREGFHLGLDTEGEDAIIHSQKFALVDHRGEIRGYYDSEDEESMKQLVDHAKILARTAQP